MDVAQHRLITDHESLVPWLAASVVTMMAFTAGIAVGTSTSMPATAMLAVALCSIVTATHLVLYRTRRSEDEARVAHRARPAADELKSSTVVITPAVGETGQLPPYAAGMRQYSSAVVELLEHAVDVALGADIDTTELASGRDDAAALHDLLTTMAAEPVHLHKAAKVHTICSLWEANQGRLERMAADVDPEFHRRWRTRNLAAIRLRHGEAPRREEQSLPYRDVSLAE